MEEMYTHEHGDSEEHSSPHEYQHSDSGHILSHEHDGSMHTHTHEQSAGQPHTHAHTHEHSAGEPYAHAHTHEHSAGEPHAHAHNHPNQKAVSNRLARAIGHLEKVKRMVDDGEDCAEILVQMAAVRSAITNAGKVLLTDHINHCIVEAVEDGDMQKIDELNEAIKKFV